MAFPKPTPWSELFYIYCTIQEREKVEVVEVVVRQSIIES